MKKYVNDKLVKKISADIVLEENEKCFALCNTSDYFAQNLAAVTIGDLETMRECGCDDDEIKKMEMLEIGWHYFFDDWWGSVFVIRLG